MCAYVSEKKTENSRREVNSWKNTECEKHKLHTIKTSKWNKRGSEEKTRRRSSSSDIYKAKTQHDKNSNIRWAARIVFIVYDMCVIVYACQYILLRVVFSLFFVIRTVLIDSFKWKRKEKKKKHTQHADREIYVCLCSIQKNQQIFKWIARARPITHLAHSRSIEALVSSSCLPKCPCNKLDTHRRIYPK